MTGYSDPEYWERRYVGMKDTDEWLQTYAGVKGVLEPLGRGDVLVLGCGNSLLGEEMALDGYRSVRNIDLSQTVIAKMQARPTLPNLSYEVMDVRSLTYPPSSFDLVVDKSTMDCLYCGVKAEVSIMVREAERVLRPGGYYVVISFGEPEERMDRLKEVQWEVKVERLEDEEGPHVCHYCYICHKQVPS